MIIHTMYFIIYIMLMIDWWLLMTVIIIHILGLVSPGPDFVIAVKHSLQYSRATGFWTALGIGLGIIVHVSYCFLGIAFIVSQSILLFNIIKLCGAGYLIFLWIKALLSWKSDQTVVTTEQQQDISPLTAIKIGFLTNALNPKATVFFLWLFTTVVPVHISLINQIAISSTMVVLTIVWFSIVVFLFTQKKVQRAFNTYSYWIMKIFWAVLVWLGLKIALTK